MNVPKIRFSNFSDDYISKNLKDVFNFYRGNTLSKSDLVENGNNKCILYGELYTKYSAIANIIYSKTNNNNKNLIYGKKYDVLMPCSGETALDISTSTCLQEDNVIIGGDLTILRPIKDFGNYLSYYLCYKKKIEIAKFAQGDSVVHLYADKIKNLSLNLPTYEEQKKVSRVLELLDKKIELQSKKIEDLKLFKKGLSNKVFSNLDIIKEEKLGNLCNITTGKLDANAMAENGKYRFYTCAKDYYYIDKYAFDTEALLISGNGAYVGYIHYYKGKFNAYQRTYVLDQFTENIQYIKVYLDEFLSKRINSEKKEGNTPYIVLSTLSDMEIKLTNPNDENNVINTFNSINIKIDKEELKLNKLIELKKGLMQNMFV